MAGPRWCPMVIAGAFDGARGSGGRRRPEAGGLPPRVPSPRQLLTRLPGRGNGWWRGRDGRAAMPCRVREEQGLVGQGPGRGALAGGADGPRKPAGPGHQGTALRTLAPERGGERDGTSRRARPPQRRGVLTPPPAPRAPGGRPSERRRGRPAGRTRIRISKGRPSGRRGRSAGPADTLRVREVVSSSARSHLRERGYDRENRTEPASSRNQSSGHGAPPGLRCRAWAVPRRTPATRTSTPASESARGRPP